MLKGVVFDDESFYYIKRNLPRVILMKDVYGIENCLV